MAFLSSFDVGTCGSDVVVRFKIRDENEDVCKTFLFSIPHHTASELYNRLAVVDGKLCEKHQHLMDELRGERTSG